MTDFSSLVARIPANTQVVYIPWQLAPKAQLFGQQLRAAGKNATLFGSDGLFDPDNFRIPGSYVSFFPFDPPSSADHRVQAHSRRQVRPVRRCRAYVATDVRRTGDRQGVPRTARRRAPRSGGIVAQTNMPKAQSLLGFQIRFVQRLAAPLGPGDMQRPANFGIYRVATNSGVVHPRFLTA